MGAHRRQERLGKCVTRYANQNMTQNDKDALHVRRVTKYTARSLLVIMVIWADNPCAQNAENTGDRYLRRVDLIASLGMSN